MKNLAKIFFIVLIPIVIIYTYWGLSSTYFLQDEWAVFGNLIQIESAGNIGKLLLYPVLKARGHFVPFSYLQTVIELNFFQLNFSSYAFVSIFTHIISSLLVFYLASLIFKNKILAFVSALFFAVNSISSQAIIWIAASPNTQGSVLFLLLSLIFLIKYLRTSIRKNYFFSLAFFFVGLLFKESILFFFFLSPLIWILYTDKKNWKKFFEFLKPLFFLGIIYSTIRVSLFLIPSPVIVRTSNTVNLSIISDISRLVSLPFRIISQSIIPQSFLISLSDKTIIHFYHQFILSDGSANPFVAQTIVFDQVVYVLSGIMLLLGLLIYKFLTWKKEKNLSKAIIFSFTLIMFSSFPFAFIPGAAANFSIFEPRDLHAASIGGSLLVVLVGYGIAQLFLSNKKYIAITTFVLLLPLLLMHIKLTRAEIYKIVGMSEVRKSILNFVTEQYPVLPEGAVFYIKSDTAYYGLPESEKIPPFQSGFGRTLLVWYYFHGQKFPNCFFENAWLYDLLEQGYKKCEGRSFGYYRNYKDLISAVKQYNISQDAIIAFSWDGNTRSFTDISDATKKKLVIDK